MNLTAFVVSIISLAFSIVKAQSNVTRGSSLTPTGDTTSWLSPSRLYAFGFYPQTGGYAVGIYISGIPEKTVVWTAIRDTLPFSNNATLRFTSDGRLTVDQTQGRQINLFDTGGAYFAYMQDSGNFVLYDSTGSTVLWQSFDHPTETLLTGQSLLPGQTLFSSVSETDQSIGVFKLSMQTDGNLVLYPNRGTNDPAYWATETPTLGPNVTLNLDSSGFLYLLQNSTNFIYNLTQGGYPTKDALYIMKFDWDGIFRLYYHNLSNIGKNGSVIWAWSSNKCAGKGLCGTNGYCSLVEDAARCRCLPGFEFVNPDRWSLGCQRNATVESCKISDANTAIQMTNLNNAQWEEATYAIPIAPTQEECSSACLKDCNCEVALFSGQECRLQRLPLRYIEVIGSQSNVGLIKVYTSSVNPTNSLIRVKKVRQKEIFVTGVSLILFAVLVLLISGVIMYRTQVWAYRKISENLSAQLFEDIGPRAFSYASLEKITDGFKEELGRGTFGIVYKGTRGYVAPEWHKRLPITVKVDVYSFGIVLFNILCCRRNVDNRLPEREAILEEWVYECYEADELLKLVDYDEDVEKRRLEQMVKIGLWCVQEEPALRPSMKRVVLMLEGTVKIPIPPNPNSFLTVV
ncbi:hypothetical protein L1987_70633 [Smallanthus sonchifolius]|uniref:Uncharacterized protein n=1 Tax=Smallanthus sonchifolius TaxID=185202 RepID=A0ACB9APV5_9ASTR|nr:hypothetical protein L1987_70633 [Smallanthus sonchifolius]